MSELRYQSYQRRGRPTACLDLRPWARGAPVPKNLSRKEFVQVLGRDKASGLTDRQALHGVLSKPENRYLVRQICWVMTIEGLETYILGPRDPADLNLLVESLRPAPQRWDLDCVIGA